MNPQFYLGLAIAFLTFPLGIVIGFNIAVGRDLKEFNEKKMHILTGVIE